MIIIFFIISLSLDNKFGLRRSSGSWLLLQSYPEIFQAADHPSPQKDVGGGLGHASLFAAENGYSGVSLDRPSLL